MTVHHARVKNKNTLLSFHSHVHPRAEAPSAAAHPRNGMAVTEWVTLTNRDEVHTLTKLTKS